MPPIRGLIDLKGLRRLVDAEEIDTVIAGFSDPYGRLLGKRFDAEFFVDQVASHGTHACDYLLTADMEMEPVQGYEFANWERGYGDVHLTADLSTLRVASWLDRTAMVLCDVADTTDHAPVAEAPRTMLRRQVERAAEQGYVVQAASELEYYLFRESYRDAAARGYRDAPAAGWYLEDYHLLQGARIEDYNQQARHHLNRSGVPVESSKGEWGLGQHEMNIRYTDVMAMADRHSIQKQCMKELADRLGVSVTFMAKYAESQAGSSCHLHASLFRGGSNAFVGDTRLGPIECSPAFRHFLGGWMTHLPELMVFYAPTVNAYKRYQAGSWAPTRLAWSADNRTAGFRIVGSGDSLRIECRIAGADCNPYLAYTAALASGLDGIARQIEPPDAYEGDIYQAQQIPRVPATLHEAIDLFAASDFAREMLGETVVEHYAHFFRTEQAAFDRAVTDWERRRYFERI
ncbi:MAG: glutamine synthetase family protein [Pirellulales bacterium]